MKYLAAFYNIKLREKESYSTNGSSNLQEVSQSLPTMKSALFIQYWELERVLVIVCFPVFWIYSASFEQQTVLSRC
jgi:hypothetical protein